jgi:Lipocalin-like domain
MATQGTLMTGTTTPDSSRIAEDVIGAWRLVSYVVEDADGGNRTYPLGEDAHGVIIYAPSGHMSVQIGSTGRPQYQDGSLHGGTDAERAATAAGYLAYAGRYTVSDAGVIDHLPDVSLFPNWEHTAVPRRATIANNRLTLELVEPLVIDGRPRAGRLTWERVEVFEARTKPLGATGSSELHTAATQGER